MYKIIPPSLCLMFEGKKKDSTGYDYCTTVNYLNEFQREETKKLPLLDLPEYHNGEPLPTLPPDFSVIVSLPDLGNKKILRPPEVMVCSPTESVTSLLRKLLSKLKIEYKSISLYALKVTGFHSYLLPESNLLLTGKKPFYFVSLYHIYLFCFSFLRL